MASPFNLNPSTGREAYRQLLAENMKRFGGDRDRAVRSANIASGFGNSTAERFLRQAAAAQPQTADVPVPTPRPDPTTTASTADVPIPTPRPTDFPPDLAVSPPRPDNLTYQGPKFSAVPQNAVPMNPALSLASILRFLPPELLGRVAGRPTQPSAAIGLGMQPTLASANSGPRWE